jgi:hypothetical protein
LYDLTSIVFPNGGGVRFSDAEAINNNGQILAWGEGMYYLLSPVPEQPVFIMMLAGLLFVSGFVRARKKFC